MENLFWARLNQGGLSIPYEQAAEIWGQAISMIAAETGWRNLIAQPEQLELDPPGTTLGRFGGYHQYYRLRGSERTLYVPDGLVEVYSVTVEGREYAIGDQVWLGRRAGRADASLELEFIHTPLGGPRSIAVSGLVGGYRTLPPDLARVAMSIGTIMAVQHQALSTGGVERWTDADVSESYGSRGPWAGTIDSYLATVRPIIDAHRRPVLWH